MADTVEALVRGALRHLPQSPARNRLAGAVTAGATSLTFEFDLGGIQPGARLSVELEECGVWSVSESAHTAVVERGDNGSTAATHADGAMVLVNPTVSWFEVLNAVNDELSAPPLGVYRVRTDTFTAGTVAAYDLVADVVEVLAVSYDPGGSLGDWPRLPPELWRFDPNADATDFPSGRSLTLYGGPLSGTVRVAYKAPFTTLAALTDDVAAVSGLPARAHQILELGAALRLSAHFPVRRASTASQSDPRRAEEVTTSDTLSSPGRLGQLYERAVLAEQAALAREWG